MRDRKIISDDEIIGKKFGLLTPIERVGRMDSNHQGWLCACDCGNTKIVAGSSLLSGKNISCGCRRYKGGGDYLRTHGLSHHPIYTAWRDMIRRCTIPSCRNYKYYGAKGITVCDEWMNDFVVFYNWSLANGWRKGLSIDRFPDKKGNYFPSNCRWATRPEQDNNKTDNHLLTIDGVTDTVSNFSRMSGIATRTIFSRLDRGWNPKEAVFSPTRFSWHEVNKKNT